jgi:hypothetical protein
MKNLILTIAISITICFRGFSQNTSYCFDQTNSTYTPITGGAVLGNTSNDDTTFDNLSIGFTFNFKGTNFTQFCVNTNGYINLGAASNGFSYFPVSSPMDDYVIAVLGTDLIAQTGSVLRCQTIGTAPNRTLVVQWLNYTTYGSNSNLNFQLRLNETTNTIQFHYGAFTLETGSENICEVGLKGSISNDFDFNNVEITNGVNTWNSPEVLQSTMTSTCDLIALSAQPMNGLKFTWTPSTLISVSNDAIFCLNSNLTLNATATSGTINWYDSPTANVIISTGPTYTLTNVVQTDTVYVAMNGCLTQRTPIIYSSAGTVPNQYVFSQNSSTYSANTTGTVLGNTSNDDEVFDNLPIGFNFIFGGVMYTNFSVSTNGFIRIGSSVTNSYSPLAIPDEDNLISALGGDLEAQTGSTLSYSVSGVSPNRILTIQWQNYRYFGETGSYNFQIKLFETSNIVQFEYGSFTQSVGLMTFFQVGISGDHNSLNDFSARSASQGNNTWATSINATDRNSIFSEIIDNTFTPVSGQRYIWTPIQLNAINSPLVCAGQNANLIVTTSAGTVTWYDVPNGGTALGSGLSFTSPILTASTTYYSQLSGNNCPILPRTPILVDVIPATVTVSANGPLTICTGDSVTLTSSSSTGNLWSNGATTQSITVSNSGTHTVTVTNGTCSATSTPSNVIVNPLPLVNAGPDVTTCVGENIVLNATGALTYNWSGGVSNGLPFTPVAGAYTVTGTDVNNCQNTDQIFVVVGPLPIVVASNNGNGVLSVSSGTTYQWINCETGLPINGQVGQTFTPLANGSYAAIVSNGTCSDTSNCVVVSTAGIEELSQTMFTYEPNPTNDFLTLSFHAGLGYIRIFDYQGKEIDGYSVNSGEKLDVTNYTPGIYIIQLSSSAGTSIGRFMKQ